MAYYKIKNTSGYIRDSRSRAILSSDSSGYSAAKVRKAKIKKEKREFNQMKREISELKQMLSMIINNK